MHRMSRIVKWWSACLAFSITLSLVAAQAEKKEDPSKGPDLSDPKVRAELLKKSQNNLTRIGFAMYNHAVTARETLPAAAIYSKDGKPLLSWRVAILPFIGEDKLYKEFKLDEPWDSD